MAHSKKGESVVEDTPEAKEAHAAAEQRFKALMEA